MRACDPYPCPRRRRAWLLAPFLLALGTGCAHLEFRRDTATSGTFTSTGTAVTLLTWDLPKSALMIAQENASDARQPNLRVTSERVYPYLGWFDWVLDIVGIRYARIEGTWGFPQTPAAAPAE